MLYNEKQRQTEILNSHLLSQEKHTSRKQISKVQKKNMVKLCQQTMTLDT